MSIMHEIILTKDKTYSRKRNTATTIFSYSKKVLFKLHLVASFSKFVVHLFFEIYHLLKT